MLNDQQTSDNGARVERPPSDNGQAGVRDLNRGFGANWNRASFQYEHTLVNHPLFEADALADLAGRLPQDSDFVFWRNTKSGLEGAWGEAGAQSLTLRDTIKNMPETDSIVILKHAEMDPEFGPVLQEFLASIVGALDPRQADDVMMGEALIFINSPGRITHYHMDGECVFVAAVKGEKTFRIYDQTDRQVVPIEEIETYFDGDLDAAKLKQDHLTRCKEYLVGPGQGLHIPVNAPHWAQTGPGMAVSVTFTFDLKSTQKLRRIHKFNHHLRRLGGHPMEIGAAPLIDAGLDLGLKTLHLGHRWLKPRNRGLINYPVWTPHGIKQKMIFA